MGTLHLAVNVFVFLDGEIWSMVKIILEVYMTWSSLDRNIIATYFSACCDDENYIKYKY